MTLDEAIKHCLEVAEANKLGSWCDDDLFDEGSENYVIEEKHK